MSGGMSSQGSTLSWGPEDEAEVTVVVLGTLDKTGVQSLDVVEDPCFDAGDTAEGGAEPYGDGGGDPDVATAPCLHAGDWAEAENASPPGEALGNAGTKRQYEDDHEDDDNCNKDQKRFKDME